MSHKSQWEYFKAIFRRYRQADRRSKQAILSEFCSNTRYNQPGLSWRSKLSAAGT